MSRKPLQGREHNSVFTAFEILLRYPNACVKKNLDFREDKSCHFLFLSSTCIFNSLYFGSFLISLLNILRTFPVYKHEKILKKDSLLHHISLSHCLILIVKLSEVIAFTVTIFLTLSHTYTCQSFSDLTSNKLPCQMACSVPAASSKFKSVCMSAY